MSFLRVSYLMAVVVVIIWGVIDFLEFYEYAKYGDSPAWEKPKSEPYLSLGKIVVGLVLLVEFLLRLRRAFRSNP